jgi:hypothetical protein
MKGLHLFMIINYPNLWIYGNLMNFLCSIYKAMLQSESGTEIITQLHSIIQDLLRMAKSCHVNEFVLQATT